MRYADFEALVEAMALEVPDSFLEGVLEIAVSPKAIPDPTHAEVYTLGECIPVVQQGGDETITSRIVLYFGSFAALARNNPEFDWRQETWDTLTHELRHHLEWRARTDALEDVDRAGEENFARQAGESFDPFFYLGADEVADGLYQVDDDFFVDVMVKVAPRQVTFQWHGAGFDVPLPQGIRLPTYVVIEGLPEPPPGDFILVLRGKPALSDLFRANTLRTTRARAHPSGCPDTTA